MNSQVLYKAVSDCKLDIQINNLDHYQSQPTIFDKSLSNIAASPQKLCSVPIIRVYGTTQHGENVLVHIHGVFPYLYVEYKGSLLEDDVAIYIRKVNNAINTAMAHAYRRDEGSSRSIFVASIVVCKGVPFYGFHVGWTSYLKIYMVNPSYMPKCADILRNGEVLETKMQPHESHISYQLQFLADFNLAGCGTLKLSGALFRGPLAVCENEESLFHDKSISEDLILPESHFPKMSYCHLEIDIDAGQILNREEIIQRNIHEDLKQASSHEPLDVKNGTSSIDIGNITFVNSLKELWLDEYRRRSHENAGSYSLPSDTTQRSLPLNTCQFWRRGKDLSLQVDESILKAKQEINGNQVAPESFIGRMDIDVIPTALETMSTMFVSTSNVFAKLGKLRLLPPEQHQPLIEGQAPMEDDDKIEKILKSEFLQPQGSDSDDGPDCDEQIDYPDKLSFSSVEYDFPNDLRHSKSLIPSKRTHEFCTDSSLSIKKLQPTLFTSEQNSQLRYSTPQNFPSEDSASSNTEYGAADFLQICTSFAISGKLLRLKLRPPGRNKVQDTWKELGLSSTTVLQPYYGNSSDIPKHPYVFPGGEFNVQGKSAPFLGQFPFHTNGTFEKISRAMDTAGPNVSGKFLRYNNPPLLYKQVERWFQTGYDTPRAGSFYRSQINGPTQLNKHEFKYATQKRTELRKASISSSKYLSSMVMELHVTTRGPLHPDYSKDAISAVFWAYEPEHLNHSSICGCIFVCSSIEKQRKILQSIPKTYHCQFVDTELLLIHSLIDSVISYDPDILAGYETNATSWGYAIERSRFKYQYDLCELLGRVREQTNKKTDDRWGYMNASAIRITGRHVLNVWRVLRNELNLLKYTMENVAFHVLHYRIPLYSFESLTRWYNSSLASEMAITIKYHMQRLSITMELIDSQEIITKTCEEARIIGIDFYSVFYRGSQYKVESILTRIAKAENFIMVSPSRKQVGEQNAIECLPLILEPETKFYTSPVVVLDFQSLYPSVMIAYNYCYSTCLGRIQDWCGRNKLGFTDLKLPDGLLGLVKRENITIAPNGMIYVKSSIRKSLLSKMLSEFLDTRVMVKDGMKSNKGDAAFQRLMNNRQIALKLIANVTYGYTSATYSGRMPCVEIADSIVQTGRETMERAIEHIKSNFAKWGADVVYGDTDSLFIHFEGKSRDEAFDLGSEIAESITQMNPKPMKLKFEKVYHPCILQTKKRYAGYMYEYKDQKSPVFNAKGTETVRRDGTPALQKIEEKALRILFETHDLSKLKHYLQTQFSKIQALNISLQDFCFAKEVRIGSYRAGGRLPPGAVISAQRAEKDPHAGPQYRERVPYIVISGAPGERLVDRCVSPEYLLENSGRVHLDTEYYIVKTLLPPLERLFSLTGADVFKWYNEMPKRVNNVHALVHDVSGMGNFVKIASCKSCGERVDIPRDDVNGLSLCTTCKRYPQAAVVKLISRAQKREREVKELDAICQSCSKGPERIIGECISGDCPIYYSRKKALVNLNSSIENDWPIVTKLSLEW